MSELSLRNDCSLLKEIIYDNLSMTLQTFVDLILSKRHRLLSYNVCLDQRCTV